MATPPNPVPRPRRLRVLDSDRSYQVLTFVLFAAAWEVYGTFWGGLLLPTFTETAAAFAELVRTPEFWDAFWVSNQALVLGFACAVVIGVPLGVLLGRFRLLERITDVYLNILIVMPMAAIIPLLIMSIGFGLLARVVLVALFAVVMVVVSVRAGVRQIDPGLIQMARSFGTGEREVWRDVLIPGALPAIMTGIRLGLGRAVTGMVIVELLMVSVALGGLILQFRGTFDAAGLYAVIAAVLIESLVLIAAAQWLERRIAPWAHHPKQRKAKR